MNNQVLIVSVVGGAALVALLLVILATEFIGTEAASETGDLLHPQVLREDRPGYVIAELYQDYDPAAVPAATWTHAARTCTADIVLATQHGLQETPPTATPRPTDTPSPTDPPRNPEGYQVATRTIDTANGAGIALAALPTPRADWPTSTPRPTYTPYPTATPAPLLSSVRWTGWENRPLTVEAAGLASLEVPRDSLVRAHLEVRTGGSSLAVNQDVLMRSPLRNGEWQDGRAYLRLSDANARILVPSDKHEIDAHHRSAVLSVEASPLSSCDALDMRWEQASAVVLKAMTTQPYADWGEIVLYAAVGPDATFDAAEMRTGASSASGLHITIPAASSDSYIAFAVRSNLAPHGISCIRQSASACQGFANFRGSFDPSPGNTPSPLDMDGDGESNFALYTSKNTITHNTAGDLLDRDWTLVAAPTPTPMPTPPP